MKRTLFVMAVVLGFATAASAATLTVTSDKATYTVGETITLTVIGDGRGRDRVLRCSAVSSTARRSSNAGSVARNPQDHRWHLDRVEYAGARGDGLRRRSFNQVDSRVHRGSAGELPGS